MATTRNTRPAPRRTPDKPRITGLNMDTLTREDGAPDEPYTTVLNGKIFTFNDPLEDDWQDQVKVDANNAVAMLKSLLADDQWDEFSAIRMKSWKLIALVRDIQRYYGIDPESQGNGGASPTS